MDDLVIDITRLDEDWPDWDKVIGAAVNAALAALDKPTCGEVSVVLSNDDHVQTLNRDYRDKDKPTNVLSFPMPVDSGLMGDVILARETLEREAKAQGKTMRDHFAHLLIHGVLHLQGFDHRNDTDAQDMEGREIAALSRLGIDNPYQPSNR